MGWYKLILHMGRTTVQEEEAAERGKGLPYMP
jgi:hypothetical protein